MQLLGLVGAGIMGAGIAQVAAEAGFSVLLYDIGPAPLAAALERIRTGLERSVKQGRLSQTELEPTLARISTTTALGDFAEVDFVIETAPESLALKREIFRKLDRLCRPGVVLATNTSSLSVTQIGALARRRDAVVGMHFFNPVPAMKLVEVVEGDGTSGETLNAACALAEALGKTPVRVKDTPGFLVNRIARPYSGEALRILAESVAGIRQVDRIARMACGFRMGPFELMDLVGNDVDLAVNKSIFEQFFQESRFRPHPLQERMVMAGRLGRKSGHGWYRYQGEQILGGPDGAQYYGAPGPRPEGVHTVTVLGDPDLAELAKRAGYRLTSSCAEADLIALGSPELLLGRNPRPEALLVVEASTVPTTELAASAVEPGRVVGYGGIPSLMSRQLVEVAPGLRTEPEALSRAVQFFHSLGRDVEVVQDGPGLVAARLIATLVNEAAHALQESICTAGAIDTAMRLGVNYPRGPLEWADEIGPETILRVLRGLYRHTGDERYHPSTYLQKLVAANGYFYEFQTRRWQ